MKPPCSDADCESPAEVKGMCRRHYSRARRSSSPRPVEVPPVRERESLRDALDQAVAAATHLSVRDAAAVAAARALADKIDAWDVIVRWATQDAGGIGRPVVPANDNVSLPSFLKYLDALQLVPPAAEKAKPGPASEASPAQKAMNDMRKGLSVVPEVG